MQADDYQGCPTCKDRKLVIQSATAGGNQWTVYCGTGHPLAMNGLEIVVDLGDKTNRDRTN